MTHDPNATPDQLARDLAKPAAWPDPESSIEAIQTHISHVFLVDDRVYKMRKSVRLPFLDFSTRAARNTDCVREVELNRRLAPSVYLGIAPVLLDDAGGVRVGEPKEGISDPNLEHVVVMRRLPEGTDALSKLEHGTLETAHLEAVGECLLEFHATHGLGRPAPWSAEAWRERIILPMRESTAAIRDSGLADDSRIASIDERMEERLRDLSPALEARRVEGRAVDAHGDLHLDHVWFEPDRPRPQLIDCLEFDEDLRRIDVASEIAFLAMDLRYRGRADLAESFLSFYASRSDDYGLYRVVDFFAAYRALVRAKVAAVAAGQSSVPPAQREAATSSLHKHLDLAADLLEPRGDAGLILLCGTVGCGKSTVARRLARAGLGVPIASDRVRKVQAEIPVESSASAAPDEGLYRPEARAEIYAEILARATPVVESGRTAILDASFGERAKRDLARDWAAQYNVPVRLIEVECAEETARERLRLRSRQGADPSDAGPDFLPISLARYEPPDEWTGDAYQLVRTDHLGWEEEVAVLPEEKTHRRPR